MNLNYNHVASHVVLVVCSNKTHVLTSNEILFFEAYDNYCFVHLVNNEKILVTKSLADYQKVLSAECFYRCHRSFIVNLLHIKEICNEKGQLLLVFKNKERVKIARRRIKDFKSYFKSYLQNMHDLQPLIDKFTAS